MNDKTCDRQEAIRQAVKAGTLDAAMKEHLASCDNCQQIAGIQHLFDRLEKEQLPAPVPLTAKMILIKARLRAQQEARQKALRPLFYVQTAFQLLSAIALACLLIWWPSSSFTVESIGSRIDMESIAFQMTFLAAGGAMVIAAGLLAAFNSLSYRR